ncbi:hypothetical protein RchiOBHm_Chr7g0223081 [Rosa chinensis]|uniref:Uncharacterized protein n=1 Tax=Rosa chinensis TaxID=74649 RepID=A0A2P6PDI1_ROSCH|nr:hypothetical protein RchiOBHm_Chr7g0223081 [Rosa chinensis]
MECPIRFELNLYFDFIVSPGQGVVNPRSIQAFKVAALPIALLFWVRNGFSLFFVAVQKFWISRHVFIPMDFCCFNFGFFSHFEQLVIIIQSHPRYLYIIYVIRCNCYYWFAL